jgi:sugar transferase (PEP-CTERM/EpsH1 system associated)
MADLVMVSDRLPIPTIGGDRLRAYRIGRFLRERGWGIHLVCFARDAHDETRARHAPEREAFASIELVPFPKPLQAARSALGLLGGASMQVAYHRSPAMKRRVEEVAKRVRPAAAIAHLSRMAGYVRPGLAPRRILEMTDVFFEYYRRAKRTVRRRGPLLYSVEEPRIRRHEIDCVRRFDAVVLVSERERERLAAAAGHPERIHAIPNGVPPEWLDIAPTPEPRLILFHGSLAYPPNAEAALWFAREVLPRIPDARFRIVGADPPPAIRALHGKDGVEVTGTVESVVPHLRQAAVSVCPLRVAAGIQNKVLEAMALGAPVVSTSAALAGIRAEPGRDLAVADTAEGMAAEVAALLDDPSRRARLSAAGRRLVAEEYLWSKALEPYLALLG